MNITFTNNYNPTYNNTFGATPIYKIALKSIDNTGIKLVKGNFSQLSPTSPSDVALLKEIKQNWGKNDCNLSVPIVNDFFAACQNKNQNAFYLTELETGNEYSRIKSILEVTNPTQSNKNIFAIEFLQSLPKTLKQAPNIKGAGELSVYGAIKLAKDNNFKQVYIHSTENDFYKHIGLEPFIEMDNNEGFFVLLRKDFKALLEKIEKKYSFRNN